MTHDQNAGQDHDINTAHKSFKNVAKLKYLGTVMTNNNCIRKKIIRRLNMGNACFHEVQNLLSSHLLCKYLR
jgi:hypothetical protein